MSDQPVQRHPATLEINGNTFEGLGALAQNGVPKNNIDGNIVFSYEQLGVLTRAEAEAKIHAQPTGIFKGTCYLFSGETETIQAKVAVRPILTQPSQTHIAFLIEFISHTDGKI